jgi:hypothetical protein
MKLARISILLTIGVIIFFMVSCPGIYDSSRRAKAWRDYHDSPNDVTRKEVVDAKTAANRTVIVIESFSIVVVIFLGVLFYRQGKNSN